MAKGLVDGVLLTVTQEEEVGPSVERACCRRAGRDKGCFARGGGPPPRVVPGMGRALS